MAKLRTYGCVQLTLRPGGSVATKLCQTSVFPDHLWSSSKGEDEIKRT